MIELSEEEWFDKYYPKNEEFIKRIRIKLYNNLINMGLFSWVTQDTDRSIPCMGACRPTFSVTMTDNKGNKWTETEYEGYGEFGGKDYYELLAEMNGQGSDRDKGIGLSLDEGVLHPNLTEDPNWEWRNQRPEDCNYQGFFYPEDETTDYWEC